MKNENIPEFILRKNRKVSSKIQFKELKSGMKLEIIEHLIAECKVLETVETRDDSNSKGRMRKEELFNVLNSSFGYGVDLSKAIINQMIDDHLLEDEGRFVSVNQFIKHADNLYIMTSHEDSKNKT